MLGYGKVKWQSDVLEHNIKKMLCVMACYATAQFCNEVRAIACAPGSLHVKLAQLSDDIPGDPSATFYGRLIGSAGSHFRKMNAEDLVCLLSPFFTWDYGIEALKRGSEALEWDYLAKLLQLAPEAVSELAEALWLTGLLQLGGFSEWGRAVDTLKRIGVSSESPRSVYRSVSAEAVERIARFVEDGWHLPCPPAAWDARRIKLWVNAVVMAKHYHPDPAQEPRDSQEVFRHLLGHVVQGGEWPLDCEANQKFEERHDQIVARFKTDPPVRRVPDVLGGTVTVQFQSDPLKILSIDNVFSTCLRLGAGEHEHTEKLLGWATNVNVRIITVSGEDERILATRAIGLCVEECVGVVQSSTCAKGNHELKQAIDDFVDDFLERAKLEKVYGRKVKETCAEACNDYWLPEPDA